MDLVIDGFRLLLRIEFLEMAEYFAIFIRQICLIIR